MTSINLIFGLLLGLLGFTEAKATTGALMGLDFGDDTMKVALVVPGRGISLMLDGQSKRMIPSNVFFGHQERFFGNEASNHIIRSPGNAITQIKSLLDYEGGLKQIQSALAQKFAFDTVTAADGETIAFSVPLTDKENVSISPEVALAMFLKNLKTFNLEHYSRVIKGAVFSVPSYSTQSYRKAIMKAAQIADFPLNSLIKENSAAAFHYATKDKSDNGTKLLVFNMGAAKTELTVFGINPRKNGKKVVTETAYAYNKTLGGSNYDVVMMNAALNHFKKSHNLTLGQIKELEKDRSALMLLKEKIQKAKKILSVNDHTNVQIDNFFAGLKLDWEINQKEFAEISRNLTGSLVALLAEISEKAEFDKIVFIGASTRILAVRETIRDFTKKPVSEIINTDESPALGTALRAAIFSSAYRTNKVRLQERNPYRVDAEIKGKKESPLGLSALNEIFLLFDENDFLGDTKAVVFDGSEDFSCKVYYKNKKTLPENLGHDLFEFEAEGVEKFQSENEGKGVPKVQLLFELGHNGIIRLKTAKAFYGNLTDEKPAAKTKKTENLAKNETKSVSVDLDATYVNGFEKNGDMFSDEDIEKAIKILEKFDKRDAETVKSAKRMNKLEELIYQFSDLFESKTFEMVTIPKERDSTKELVKNAKKWIDSHREPMRPADDYKEQINILKNSTTDLVFRLSELSRLPKAVDYAHEFLNITNQTIQLIVEQKPWISNETISAFVNQTNDFIIWLNENIEKYKNHSKTEKPVFVSDDVVKRIKPIKDRLKEISLMEKVLPPTDKTNATRAAKRGPSSPGLWRKRRLRRTHTLFQTVFDQTRDMFLKGTVTPALTAEGFTEPVGKKAKSKK